jgi:hypothetical protein
LEIQQICLFICYLFNDAFSIDWMIVNNELERAFTAAVAAYFTVLLRHNLMDWGSSPGGGKIFSFFILSRPALVPVGTAGDFHKNKGAGA